MLKGFLKHRFLQLAGAAGLVTYALAASAGEPAHAKSLEANWKLLEDYCVECHNATDWAGGVAFDTMEPASVAAAKEDR